MKLKKSGEQVFVTKYFNTFRTSRTLYCLGKHSEGLLFGKKKAVLQKGCFEVEESHPEQPRRPKDFEMAFFPLHTMYLKKAAPISDSVVSSSLYFLSHMSKSTYFHLKLHFSLLQLADW